MERGGKHERREKSVEFSLFSFLGHMAIKSNVLSLVGRLL